MQHTYLLYIALFLMFPIASFYRKHSKKEIKFNNDLLNNVIIFNAWKDDEEREHNLTILNYTLS